MKVNVTPFVKFLHDILLRGVNTLTPILIDWVERIRITKTINYEESSPAVTTGITCDIEEIHDENTLRELLEQSTSYTENLKIRLRLENIMAEREDKNQSKAGEKSVTTEPDNNEDESSSSEYEEIIEEVTDYSDEEDEENTSAKEETKKSSESDPKDQEKTNKSSVTKLDENKKIVQEQTEKSELKEQQPKSKIVSENSEEVPEPKQSATAQDNTDNSEKGESLLPLLQDLLHKNMPQAKTSNPNGNTTSSTKNINTNTNKNSTVKTCAAGNKNANDSSESRIVSVSNNNSNINSKIRKDPQQHTQTTATTTKDEKTKVNPVGSSSNNLSPKQVDRLSVPQKEDSGTESGEDLRIIAAGLRDKLHMESDTNLIEEVTTALSRLESSLKEGKEIPVDGTKRNALLALVARLQTGLTSPEKLAELAMVLPEIEGNELNYNETSSPEADAHRSNRQRFAKRRNRVNRHTVGVSREELEDARRYMEDMIMMENISNCTTPESSLTPVAQPQWFPIEKNLSSGAILTQQPSTLYRPNQFVPNNIKRSTECLDADNKTQQNSETRKSSLNNRRPLSGEFSVKFENPDNKLNHGSSSYENRTNAPSYDNRANVPTYDNRTNGVKENERLVDNVSPDAQKSSRFFNKKQLMKRANTIDIPKTKKYNPEFDTDSEMEDKGSSFGLKRAVQVSVKQKVRHVIPPFEPKTENDHKFLAFINKQSPKSGLGWNGSRSVTNWTNKFGNIKHTFEVGAAAQTTTGKPPPVPGHVLQNVGKSQMNKHITQKQDLNSIQQQQQLQYQQQQQKQQQQQQQQQRIQQNQIDAAERHRRMEKERIERERIERDRLERQRQERERMERDRLEREFYERERLERERIAAEQHAAMPSMTTVPKPSPVNKFIHAPQSVFKPIENNDINPHQVFKPIPQIANKANVWQPPSTINRPYRSPQTTTSPQYLPPKQSSVPSSPVGLPWVSKPSVDNSSFRNKANRFEEGSLNDNHNSPHLYRNNSLRSSKDHHQYDEYKKRPSLPNTADPYLGHDQGVSYGSSAYLPPPTNISFTYADQNLKSHHRSYPNLTTEFSRKREDSLTNPQGTPLVLTTDNPSYTPQAEPPQNYVNPPLRQFEYNSPLDSNRTSPSLMTMPQTDYTDDDLDSDMLEYRVESKVMGKPQSQTAITVGRRTAHVSDDEVYGKNSRAAKNLLHTMKTIGTSNNGKKANTTPVKKPATPTTPRTCLSPDGRSYQAPIVDPLFPQLTNFEPQRKPIFASSDAKNSQRNQVPSSGKSYEPSHEDVSRNQNLYRDQQLPEQQYIQPSPHTKQYVTEAQTPYVVTYPSDDHIDSQESIYQKQHPTSLPIQRIRNISENSTTSSSMSYNIPSPGTTWTANPVHVDATVRVRRKSYNQSELGNNKIPQDYQPQHYVSNTGPPVSQPTKPNIAPIKPELAPKPSIPPLNIRNNQNITPQQYTPPIQRQQPQTPPQYYQTPPAQLQQNVKPQQYTPPIQQQQQNPLHYNQTPPVQPVPNKSPQYSTPPLQQQQPAPQYYQTTLAQSQPNSIPQQYSQPIHQQQHPSPEHYQPPVQQPKSAPLPQQQPVYQPINQQTKASAQQQSVNQKAPQKESKPLSSERPKLKTMSSASKSFENAQVSLRRQKTLDSDMPMAPLQTQNRVLSQQSLVAKQQQQFQQQRQQHQVTEIRRKSLGNALDSQQQRQLSYFKSQNEIKQEYKSSAPADTPDIVKSSLPKDENMPILKKFGPPQRHHYLPNSYQSGSGTSQTQKSANSNTTVTTSHREVVQHSTFTTKPSIVETPATPQPSEDQIPRNIVFNNVSAFTSMARRHDEERFVDNQFRQNKLSKSDSWNQIVQMHNQPPPSAPTQKFGGNELRRSKSGHSLAVPKMYEAGINKAEVSEKQKTVAAYFSGKKSPSNLSGEEDTNDTNQITVKKSAILRTKTKEKVSASRKSLSSMTTVGSLVGGGLSRSATMPHIANLNLLDETNVEDAFEQLIMGS